MDAAFSLEPEEMKALVEETGRAAKALGTIQYGPTEAEQASLAFRRSCSIGKDLHAGNTLTRENLRIIRPGQGVPPKDYDHLLGMRVNQELKMGIAMRWEYVG